MKYVNFTRIFLGCLLLVMTEVVNAYQVGVPKIVVKSFPIEMYGIDPTTEELSFPHRNPVLVSEDDVTGVYNDTLTFAPDYRQCRTTSSRHPVRASPTATTRMLLWHGLTAAAST